MDGPDRLLRPEFHAEDAVADDRSDWYLVEVVLMMHSNRRAAWRGGTWIPLRHDGDTVIQRLLKRPDRAGLSRRLLTAGMVVALEMGIAVPLAAAAPPKPDKVLNFDSATYAVTEGDGQVCIYVDRSVTKGKAPTVTAATSSGTATVGSDYNAVETTVSFTRGSSQSAVCVPILVDGVSGDPDETFTLTLSNPSRGWIIGTPTTTTVTIHEMAVPSAPTGLVAALEHDSAGSAFVSVTWTASTGSVDHYGIGSSTQTGGPYTELATTTGLSYDVTPAPSVDTYYVVRAVNADNGASNDSNEAFVVGFVPGAGLYWADYFGSAIKAANLDGTGARTLVSGAGSPLGVAVDATHVYWAGAGAIKESSLDGSNVTTLVSGTDSLYGVAVDASSIYWTDFTAGTIMRADLNGSNVTKLVSGEFDPSSIAVTASHIYWTNWHTSGTIKEADLNDGTVTTLVTGQDNPFAIAADNFYVYWVNEGDINTATGTVDRAPLDDPSQVTILANYQRHPDGLAVDASHIYWANSQAGTINRANLDGTSPTLLVSGTNQPAGVAVTKS